MIMRLFLYGAVLLHLAVLFPGAVLSVNRYKLIDPNTVTPPDPDTVAFVYILVALFAISVVCIVALAWTCRKADRYVVFGIVGLTTGLVIAARLFGS